MLTRSRAALPCSQNPASAEDKPPPCGDQPDCTPALHHVWLLTLGLCASGLPASAAEPAAPQPGLPEYVDATVLGAGLNAGLGTGLVGDHLVGELGAASFGLESAGARRWLWRWDGQLAARGGTLANQHPYAPFVGGRGQGSVELGARVNPAQAWSGYVGGRLAADLQVMAHPGLSLGALDTLNNSDGFGGVTADGALRVVGGFSSLDEVRSLLLVAFAQELLRGPGVVAPGAALTEFGLSARVDFARSCSLSFEALAGFAPSSTNQALHLTDQLARVEVGGALRKTFGNGAWLGLAVSFGKDSHHLVYLETKTVYDSARPPDFTTTLSFGLPLWRQP